MLPFNTKFKTCVCVCVVGGGGGGGREGGEYTKQFLVKENQVMEQNQPPTPHPQSSVWCDDYF